MGIGENIKGAMKEKAGEFSGNEELEAEGDAQQRKGREQTEESKDRAAAKAHEKKADALEYEQHTVEE